LLHRGYPWEADDARGYPGGIELPDYTELSKEDLESFIAAWREAYGETLSMDEARAYADRVVRFVLRVTRKLQSEEEQSSDTENANLQDFSWNSLSEYLLLWRTVFTPYHPGGCHREEAA
jgi:hypothetical protein